MSLSLPSGVTFTSASGEFLAASSVPEPSTPELLALGMIAIFITKGRARRVN